MLNTKRIHTFVDNNWPNPNSARGLDRKKCMKRACYLTQHNNNLTKKMNMKDYKKREVISQ